MSKRISQKGFTLIELLVVIAIIGILSSVILASLSSARTKGRVAAAQETMHSIRTAAASCLNDSVAVNIPTATNNGGGGAVCTGGSGNYSALPSGWIYCDGTSVAGAGSATACNNNALSIGGQTGVASIQTTGVSFRISAYSSADLKAVTCLESGCTTATAL